MSIRSALEEAAMYVDLFNVAMVNKLSIIYPHIGTSYKGSSTKKGNNPKQSKRLLH